MDLDKDGFADDYIFIIDENTVFLEFGNGDSFSFVIRSSFGGGTSLIRNIEVNNYLEDETLEIVLTLFETPQEFTYIIRKLAPGNYELVDTD